MMSYPAMSLGDCMVLHEMKGGTGRDGWVHLKGENSMAVSGLGHVVWSQVGHFSCLIINGPRK